MIEIHGDQFEWMSPPYDYEYEKKPIDLILGDARLRREIEKGSNPRNLKEAWLTDLRDFLEWRKPYLLYD